MSKSNYFDHLLLFDAKADTLLLYYSGWKAESTWALQQGCVQPVRAYPVEVVISTRLSVACFRRGMSQTAPDHVTSPSCVHTYTLQQLYSVALVSRLLLAAS